MLFQISLFLITETLHDNKQLECSGKWHNAFVEAQIASFELKMKFDLLLSPGRKRMFIWNNIFFSFAFDSRDHFQELGGKLSL